jgi:uncharacterized protein (TIGR03790 family)
LIHKRIIYIVRRIGIIRLITVMLTSASGLMGTAGADNSHEKDRFNELGAVDLAVIVNDADPTSVRIAEYYKYRRGIPESNIIHVRFMPGSSTMSRTEFQKIKSEVDRETPGYVQAYALAWTQPYRVECMSITTAFTAGFDKAFCSDVCGPTRPSPYFNSSSTRPYDDYGWRPTMMLAGRDFKAVKKLIDRGVASDHTFPHGTGYLVSTSDKARNVRAVVYPEILERYMGSPFDIRLVNANFIQNRKNVLFYFTGIVRVTALDSIRFVPGAIADHLTSRGGVLFNGDQMSILRWLEAGATASYGTVSEPCNFPQKFPQPGIVIDRYLHGERLIEAYWKSVAWPGQGLFVGEPLADPFGTTEQESWVQRNPEREQPAVHPVGRN